MDVRYAFIILPILYALSPFILSGAFISLGITTGVTFFSSAAILLVLTGLNIVGSGMNQEGTYQAFVLVFGGMFYFVNVVFTLVNGGLITHGVGLFLLRALGIGGGSSNSSASATQGLTPTSVFPTSFTFAGIAVFPTIDAVLAVVYVLGLYFMVSSRGH